VTGPGRPATILRLRGEAGAAEARGLVVVIDVLRAFTTAAYAFAGGATEILLVRTVEEAFALKALVPDALLIGEVGGRLIPGFDLDNSPTHMAAADVAGRPLIQRTGAGTQCAVLCSDVDALVLGSLVVAAATVRHVSARSPDVVSLLATEPTHDALNEDDACADHLQALLAGRPVDAERTAATVRAAGMEREIVQRLGADFPATDIDLAVAVDRFDFAMTAERAMLPESAPAIETLVARRVVVA
jgi:2-phosphosulfolactate phosphatase